jgi:beta-glucosidase
VTDLQAVLDARDKMNGKPVIVVLNMSNPTVVSEFEPSANAIVVSFGVQDHDMQPYVDAEGHAYDFVFGLNWAGVINDARTATYGKGRKATGRNP